MKRALPFILGAVCALFACALVLIGAVLFDERDSARPERRAQAAAAAAADTCRPDRFEVTSKTSRTQAGRLIVVAAVRNANLAACGVQMSLETFDAKGERASVQQPWPASTSNIQPGDTYAFEVILSAEESARVHSWTIAPLRAKAW